MFPLTVGLSFWVGWENSGLYLVCCLFLQTGSRQPQTTRQTCFLAGCWLAGQMGKGSAESILCLYEPQRHCPLDRVISRKSLRLVLGNEGIHAIVVYQPLAASGTRKILSPEMSYFCCH